jgi:hypothetical protein
MYFPSISCSHMFRPPCAIMREHAVGNRQMELDWKFSGWVPLVCLREYGSGPYYPVQLHVSANRVNREESLSSQSVISVNFCLCVVLPSAQQSGVLLLIIQFLINSAYCGRRR